MILIIDNYDSFTYNLKQVCEEQGFACEVIRNDQIQVSEIIRMAPDKILLSPGPGDPDSAGVTLEVIRELSGKIPIFGVCLGCQAIGQAFGGKVIRAPRPKHGKISRIKHRQDPLFKGVPSPFKAARYHSLIIEKKSLPKCLIITAESEDGLIMGVRHRQFAVEGVQFHPESIATEGGKQMVGNFLRSGGAKHA